MNKLDWEKANEKEKVAGFVPATKAQISFIKELNQRLGLDTDYDFKNMRVDEASVLIDALKTIKCWRNEYGFKESCKTGKKGTVKGRRTL